VVFDGLPHRLTAEAVRHIYGVAADANDFNEAATSTTVTAPAQPVAAYA
jgi:hypothetical protein